MHRQSLRVITLLAVMLLAAAGAPAQTPRVSAEVFTTNVTLTTTAETAIVTSRALVQPRATMQALVIGCAQLTTGTATTTVTPRIRRGTDTSGTLVGEANAVTIGAAVGSTEQFCGYALEERAEGTHQYTLTLAQAAATGNGTALYGFIVVLLF